MSEFTDAERALLRALNARITLGRFIASPEFGPENLRDGTLSGGGRGFSYEATKTALQGRRHEWIPDRWFPDGRIARWREGALLWEARVTYARLQRWAESLPPKVREQALIWYRTKPEDTRDLDALARLTLYAISLDDPEPKLFEIPETAHA